MHPTRIFKSPSELKDAWEGYKKNLQVRAMEWPKVQYVGKDGNRVEDYPKLPLTLEGFYVFGYDNYGTVKHYFENKDGLYHEFGGIVSHIREEIRNDQITGALLGQYNSNITARLQGLKDVTETENKSALPTKIEFVFSDMSGTPKEDQE